MNISTGGWLGSLRGLCKHTPTHTHTHTHPHTHSHTSIPPLPSPPTQNTHAHAPATAAARPHLPCRTGRPAHNARRP